MRAHAGSRHTLRVDPRQVLHEAHLQLVRQQQRKPSHPQAARRAVQQQRPPGAEAADDLLQPLARPREVGPADPVPALATLHRDVVWRIDDGQPERVACQAAQPLDDVKVAKACALL
jgi:hypothetical protein